MAFSLTATPSAAATPPKPRAWILVDVDTGRVLDGFNSRTPLPPASLSKIFTAIAAARVLPPGATVPVSPRAAGAPAFSIGMVAGTTWTLDSALHALLMSSANDVAVALAERVSGSLTAFRTTTSNTAARLGLADGPVVRDPAGLDDASSVGGGNLVSARDLAITARSLLTEARIAPIVAQWAYEFRTPGGVKRRLVNHNKMLQRYSGTIGVKTGYTRKSGGCLITAATRKGRTMLAVVLGAPDIYGSTKALLDKGFATPVAAEPRADRLPPLPAGARIVIRLRAKPVATSLRARASIVAFVAAPLGLLVLVKLRRRAHGRAVRRRRSL